MLYNELLNTIYNSLLKPTPKINNLDIVLESDGKYSTTHQIIIPL